MSTTDRITTLQLHYHPAAYQFVDAALRYTQRKLNRVVDPLLCVDDEEAHITACELLHGIRDLAEKEFGLMTCAVFQHWGVHCTDDFGRIVFDFIERGIMRKTDQDQLSDFCDVYDFEDIFDRQYRIDTTHAFEH